MFTVKQLSRLAGITPRALRFYDEIGLLKPTRVGENGYRYYDEEALLRLQQILLYRELDLPLDNIKQIMGRPDFDVLAALEQHRDELRQRMARIERLAATVDDTISYLKGTKTMDKKQFFEGFSDAQQAEYSRKRRRCTTPKP